MLSCPIFLKKCPSMLLIYLGIFFVIFRFSAQSRGCVKTKTNLALIYQNNNNFIFKTNQREKLSPEIFFKMGKNKRVKITSVNSSAGKLSPLLGKSKIYYLFISSNLGLNLILNGRSGKSNV